MVLKINFDLDTDSVSHISILDVVGSSEHSSIDIINETIRRRANNKRDDVTQSLRAGRELAKLKATVPHGSWRTYVMSNTDYRSEREYQIDMRFWEYWRVHIPDLTRLGVIHDMNAPEFDLVNSLSDAEVNVCFSALQEFIGTNVPDFAMDAALRNIELGNGLSISDSKKIASAAKLVNAMPDGKARDVAKDLILNHGAINPDVIEILPQVINESPDLVDEMRTTGTIFVPGVDNGNGRQVRIENASRTDFELALGRSSIEYELGRQQKIRSDFQDKADYNHIVTLEGTPSQIITQLQRYLLDTSTSYKVTISQKQLFR
jgi:hypothetical protein